MIKRYLLLIGNGIGRALENRSELFKLDNALAEGWEYLDSDSKNLIRNIIFSDTAPKSEDDLHHIQRYLWETGDKQVEKYLAATMQQFLQANSEEFLKTNLCKSICELIQQDETNIDGMNVIVDVATINYDWLLYGAFFNSDLFEQLKLVDGFLGKEPTVFRPEDCFARNRHAGWFLHLHGSPLFQTYEKTPIKLAIRNVDELCTDDFLKKTSIEHVVMTSRYHKSDCIGNSPILSAYWEKFTRSLCGYRLDKHEQFKVFCIGYSGYDAHINQAIRNSSAKEVDIVEYSKPDWYKNKLREAFWKSKFPRKKVCVHSCDNINLFKLKAGTS